MGLWKKVTDWWNKTDSGNDSPLSKTEEELRHHEEEQQKKEEDRLTATELAKQVFSRNTFEAKAAMDRADQEPLWELLFNPDKQDILREKLAREAELKEQEEEQIQKRDLGRGGMSR
ncbi:MAG: hypothetical protein KGJ06_07800 [Pseudomonadota bacterium]|nr:hypothetical protein [Pseudomonadota bacterium]